uniref:Uncharacterized protein n=1 Tax=Oryza punctata TaxID=4537 RepID=A0A0E0LMK0_ORYPU
MAPMLADEMYEMELRLNSLLYIRSSEGHIAVEVLSDLPHCWPRIGQRMRAEQPKFQNQSNLVRIKPARNPRVHHVNKCTLAPLLSHPVHEHDAVAVLILLDWPPPTGDLEEERAKREHVCGWGCLACVPQLRG